MLTSRPRPDVLVVGATRSRWTCSTAASGSLRVRGNRSTLAWRCSRSRCDVRNSGDAAIVVRATRGRPAPRSTAVRPSRLRDARLTTGRMRSASMPWSASSSADLGEASQPAQRGVADHEHDRRRGRWPTRASAFRSSTSIEPVSVFALEVGGDVGDEPPGRRSDARRPPLRCPASRVRSRPGGVAGPAGGDSRCRHVVGEVPDVVVVGIVPRRWRSTSSTIDGARSWASWYIACSASSARSASIDRPAVLGAIGQALSQGDRDGRCPGAGPPADDCESRL